MQTSRRGFTLIELLVVVAIIVLLIAILLPSLGKAKEQAKRASCLSNLHQMGLSLGMYRMNFNEVVPIGCVTGCKQWNYGLYWGGSTATSSNNGVPFAFGLLNVSGDINANAVKAFYCPTTNSSNAAYNLVVGANNPDVSGNPWRDAYASEDTTGAAIPGVPWSNDPKYAGHSTRMGYSMRPVVNWGSGPQAGAKLKPVLFSETTNTITNVVHWPKFSELSHLAVASDMSNTGSAIEQRHNTGVNVLYGEGSAYWVPQSDFWDASLPIFDPTSAAYFGGFLTSYNGYMLSVTEPYTGVWGKFDNRR